MADRTTADGPMAGRTMAGRTTAGETMTDDGALAASLATQLRQSLHGCATHPSGPLAAFDRCCEALADGGLSPDEFRDVGTRLVAMSEARLAAGSGDRALVQRETRLI